MKDETRPPTATKSPGGKVDEILDRLERQANEALPPGTRRERRWTYRRSGLGVNIEHPGGGFAKLATLPIALWCEGIQVVFSGFAYAGSACTVALVSKDGETVLTRGVVVSCKHVERVLHCAEIKFAQRIDPHLFVDPPKGAGDAGAQLDLPNLHGKVLHIDDSEFDSKLLAHHLRGSNIELVAVKTPEEALDIIGRTMFDIILCDLNLGNGLDSAGLIGQIRGGGFVGPIVILSAENHPDKLRAAKAAGADHSLAKPYARSALVQTMIKLHQEVGAITAGEVIYSTLGDQADTDDLLANYVRAAQEISKNIQDGVIARNFDSVRELCLNLKGSAPGYGFGPLGLAAEEAIKALDSTLSVDESKPKLRMLMLMCAHLGLRKNAAVA